MNVLRVSKKPTTYATRSAKMATLVCKRTAGVTVLKASKATVHSVRNLKVWVAAGVLRSNVTAVRSGESCGTLSVPKDITLKAAACALPIVLKACQILADSAPSRLSPDRTLIP